MAPSESVEHGANLCVDPDTVENSLTSDFLYPGHDTKIMSQEPAFFVIMPTSV